MARLHLVRHGETDWNAQRRYQGSNDIPLNERGRAQAKEVGEKLSHLHFSAIYASTLSRAIETAELIGPKHPHPIQTLSSLVEGSFGPLEGETIDQIHTDYSHLIEKHKTLSNEEKLHFKFVEGMESGMDVIKRVEPTLIEIATRHDSSDVLIVTHGGVIRSLLVHYAKHDWSSVKIQNGQRVAFEFLDGTFHHIPL